MTVKRLDRLSWSRSGRPLSGGDRKVMLAVLRRAKREGRIREIETTTEAADVSVAAKVATRRGDLGRQTGVTASRGRPPPR
jgi:hypothetical protein